MAADLFDRAPDEVIRYFESKGQKVSFDWRDVAPEEHAHAFTVAKSAGFDVLDDIRSSVSEAIKKGESFASFRERLEPVLRDKGWWGRKVAYDDVKDTWRVGQLGSVRRLRTIYWANMSTAKAAGEWDRIQRTKAYLPYLVYMRSTAERKRPLHAAWASQPVVLPADDPWWSTHYPPNGWLCKCSVRQVTQAEAERLGWTPGIEPPAINMVKWFDKRNGRATFVPEGIDPGWQTNAGLNRRANVANYLGDKLSALPDSARRAALADIVASPQFRQVVANRNTLRKPPFVPVAPVTNQMKAATGTTADHIFLSVSSAWHILDERAERGLTPEMFAAAAQVIVDTNLRSAKDPSPKTFVFRGVAEGVLWRVAVKVLAGEAFLVSLVAKGDISNLKGR